MSGITGSTVHCKHTVCNCTLTAANEGLVLSPGAGCVTSAPNTMKGAFVNHDL